MFSTAYPKNSARFYIGEQLNTIFDLNQLQNVTIAEPSKRKHKSIQDQFTDTGDDGSMCDPTTPSTPPQNDEFESYLRINIEILYKDSNPLNLWYDHQKKLLGLL